MKKYFITSILSGFLLLTSCGDQLERFPVDTLVDATAFQNVNDLQNGLRAVLSVSNMPDMVQFNAAFGDNAKRGKDSGGQADNVLRQVLNPDGGDGGMWVDRYNAINQINRVLAAAESITPEDSEETTLYNDIRGQLLALRAYWHSELLIYYGINMQDSSSPGVVYQNSVETDAVGDRATTGEVLSLIEQDFNDALALLTNTDINYPTADFITFQRARIALWTGNYSTAASLATSIINSYPLANPVQYAAMFAGDADATEVIWKYDNVQGSNNSLAGRFRFTASVQDNNFIAISLGFFDVLNDPSDIRRAVFVAPDGNGSSFADEDYGINKYPPNADTQYINDFKIMRASEMYLLRAEANARQSNFAAAAADIAALRTARGSSRATPAYTDLVVALTDIKLEGRIELCFEGHRYLTIKRMRDVLNVGIERDTRDCGGATPCSLPVGSEKWIFPIPTTELNGNPEITQAPGY
jgi:hypothetical protein